MFRQYFHLGIVIEKGTTVLLDLRHEHDNERRRFKMEWAFNYLLEFVKQRGAGRHQPIGLTIDEFISLFSGRPMGSAAAVTGVFTVQPFAYPTAQTTKLPGRPIAS